MAFIQNAFHNKQKLHRDSTFVGEEDIAQSMQREKSIRRKMEDYEHMNVDLDGLIDLFGSDDIFIAKVSLSTGIDEQDLRTIDASEVERMFMAMDLDHSGTIDFNEITKYVLKLKRRKQLQDRLTRKASSEEPASFSLKDRLLRFLCSKLFFLGLLAFSMFAFGVFMCVRDGSMDVTTAVYVMGQVVTTVGYGDITPQSDISKLCVAAYCLASLVVIAYVINEFVSATMDKKQDEAVQSAGGITCCPKEEATRSMLLNSAYLVSLLLFGTVYYSIDESCSCGYGTSRGYVEGCKDGKDTSGGFDYDMCVETGGVVKSAVDCLYMSILTMTSVGFGDVTPTSWRGRCIGFFWMNLGVIFTGNWISAMTTFLFEQKKAEDPMPKECLLDWLDSNHDGKLSRAEHHLFWLVQQGAVNEDTLASLNEIFDRLADPTDQVTCSQILAEDGAEKTDEFQNPAGDPGSSLSSLPGAMWGLETTRPPDENAPVQPVVLDMSRKGILAHRKAKKEEELENLRSRRSITVIGGISKEEEEILRRPAPASDCGLGFDLSNQPVAMSKGTDPKLHAAGHCHPCPFAHQELGCPDQELCQRCHYLHLRP